MIQYTNKPIEKWPGASTKDRKRAQFTTPYGKTLQLLEKELEYLGASNVVIQIALEWKDIRNDGRPRAGARPSHPGIILSFDSKKKGPLSFPCDTYDSFEDNLRAISLALTALRAVDRYGVTQRGEQYHGWKALPETSTSSEEAALFISKASGYTQEKILKDPETRESAYKIAARAMHPDMGGKTEDFHKLQEAIQILRAGKAA